MDLKEVSISTEYLEQLHGSDLDGTMWKGYLVNIFSYTIYDFFEFLYN